ncbi:hypothetical protein [Brevibacillus centrosporus]|uniref:hypothetical protein n=1 Tax=Brevibacillus centrosporus TaxID=54910 RepID=UPI002E20D120|nr:hypothetical protein [Brevibacillus centrosporus]
MGPLEPILDLMVGGIFKFILWVLVPLLLMTVIFGKVLFRLPKPIRAIIYLGAGYGCWLLYAQYAI